MSVRDDLHRRTKLFAIRVIKLCVFVGNVGPAGVIGRQLVRSGTSVGAQYREARRGRSTAELISKLEAATQELDETIYWLELLAETDFIRSEQLEPLKQEANELMAILVTSIKTAKLKSE
jgi:four helix bundle protein